MELGEKKTWINHEKKKVPAGGEFHYGPYRFEPISLVNIICEGTDNFYAGFYDRNEYLSKRGRRQDAFNFEFGTDKPFFTFRRLIEDVLDYYLVLRVSVFTEGGTGIDVFMESRFVGK